MTRRITVTLSFAALLSMVLPAPAAQQQADLTTSFRIKYVADGNVYLEGGRNAGLIEGMRLTVKRNAATVLKASNDDASATYNIAELNVVAVADTSAVCEIKSQSKELRAGDTAFMRQEDVEMLVAQRSLGNTRKYPAVVTFTEGDPLDEEARASVPRPPLPEVNRARGRIGIDYSGLSSHDASSGRYTQLGFVFRSDITRINGTYWNLSGYYRGRITSRSSRSQPQSLQDLVNRTYHLSLDYANPNSRWTMGVGRLYVPYATSLETIDGGYIGRRFGSSTTAGVFAGTTPDPSSWNYDPDRRMAGGFVSFEKGSYDNVRFTSSSGLGISTLNWRIDRPFIFFEHGIFYKQKLSIYHSLQADQPRSGVTGKRINAGVSRSYLTFRLQPHRRVSFDITHNYFRDVPTFDPQLISTGLVDKYLFQSVSGGVRVEAAKQVWLYTNIGRSTRTGDDKNSWNALYGVTLGRLWRTGVRVDARYSHFDSSFGRGTYESVSLSRNFTENLRVDVQGGRQNYSSPLASSDRSYYVNSLLDLSLGSNYFIEGGLTFQRGRVQDYNQWFTTIGYRFDNRKRQP